MGRNFGLGCLVAVLAGVLALGVWAVGAYNRLNEADQAVTAVWSQLENACTRRADLVPTLVATVKGAAGLEKETLGAVLRARAQVAQIRLDANGVKTPRAFAEFQNAQDGLGGALSRLRAAVERDPALKANPSYRDLEVQLEKAEDRISVEQGRFDDAARRYNALRKSLPTVIIASVTGFKERPSFGARGQVRDP